MSGILSSLPICRVRYIRTIGNQTVSPDKVVATPTITSLTTPGQHGYHDLRPVTSRADPNDPTVGYLDLVVTDDPDAAETFGWTVTFENSTRPTRVVAVPQSGAGVTTITVDGNPMPAVWLDQLAVFTGPSGPVGSDVATRAYVDGALDDHEAAADPHPGYALETAVNPRLLPTGSAWNAGCVVLGAYRLWIDDTGRLRIKNGAPSSATDGTVVGTQS